MDMCTWRSARMTPLLSVIAPLGPRIVMPGVPSWIAADAQGQIDAEVNAVGVAQLDLRVIARRAEDANVGDDPLPRADERDELLGGELAFLVKIFELGELGAGAEERFQVGRRHVHVPGRDVDDQRMRRAFSCRSWCWWG